MELLIMLWIATLVLTPMAAYGRGRSKLGWFLLAALFGIFAFIAVLVLPSRRSETARA